MAGAPEVWPLNEREKALWLLQQMFPNQGVTNLGFALRVPDHAEIPPLRQSVRWIVQRHPALRSTVQLRNEGPVRVLREATQIEAAIEVRNSTSARLDADMRAVAGRAFDLERDEPVRFTIFELADGGRELLVVAHHLVFDALSTLPFIDGLTAAYDSFAATGRPPAMQPTSITALEARQATPESFRYWRDRVWGLRPDAMMLHATDYSSPEVSFAGGRYVRILSASAAEAVHELQRRTHVPDSVVLLAAYLSLLHRHGAGNELIVGLAVDLRSARQQDSIGLNFNIVPLRVQVTAEDTFASLTSRTLDVFFEALEHRDVPYEAMVHQFLRDDYDWRTPVFRHLFNFWRSRRSTSMPGDWASEGRQVDTGYSRFDLEFVVDSRDDDYQIQIAYRSDLHDEGFVRRFYDRYEALLCSAAAASECRVGVLPIATRHDVIIKLANQTGVQWPAPPTTAEMVAEQIRARPQSVAITSLEGNVTYKQLGQMATGLTALLTKVGIRAGDVVAVLTGRSPVSAAAALAAWRVGAAYMPLDPTHPVERLRFQLRDVAAAAVLASAETACQLGDSVACVIPADDLATKTQAADANSPDGDQWSATCTGAMPECEPDPADYAYVIYTSGSTGRPKAVQITHANLANVVRHFKRALEFNSSKAMTWLTTFAFDISALELFLPLASGGRVVVVNDQAQVNAPLLVSIMNDFNVDVVQATPTVWRMVADIPGINLGDRWALCGGEPMTATLARRLLATGARLMNVYGPSETTIWSTSELIDEESLRRRPSVGVPIANTTVAVLDQFGVDCPVGIVGEVVIAGAGVGAGYLHRADLTEERFVYRERMGRAYRTGDLGHWRPDGRLELHGRIDRQIKIRGQRLELGEVEAVLEDHSGVAAAAAIVHGSVHSGQAVAAFVLPNADLVTEELWSFAAERLPSYAVPGSIHFVSSLPTNASGKTDYLRLAELAADELPAAAASPHLFVALDEIGSWLVALWRELLSNPALHADSNFFLSGGQSLMAVNVASKIKKRYHISLPIVTVFNNPTPRSLSAAVNVHLLAAHSAVTRQRDGTSGSQ